MECPSMLVRQSVLRGSVCALCFRRPHATFKTFSHPSPTVSVTRRYAFTSSSRRRAAREHADIPDTMAEIEDSTRSQAHPLSGYYYDILSTSSPYGHKASPSHPVAQAAEKPTPATTVKPQTPEEKMSIVFGSRLAGPGRTSRYNSGTMPPESQWKTINGVPIPPRPEEPDNCCMSGCVHCVWDDYRDEMEEWASRVASAKARGLTGDKTAGMRQTPRAEVENASCSMDDDGGGSETNWPPSGQTEDLFSNIPLHQHHDQESRRQSLDTQSTMSISKTETDIILNKANIALARSQRLVASWLPPPTDDEKANVKADEELQREEDEIFTAVPETLGVGAPLPEKAADGSWNRTELDSNDRLRKQLLGRNYKKVMAAAAGKVPTGKTGVLVRNAGNASTPLANGAGDDHDEDDEEEGRTTLVGKKRGAAQKDSTLARKRKDVPETSEGNGNDTKESEAKDGEGVSSKQGNSSRPVSGSRGRRKGASFLDEILAERSKKRKKR